MDASVERWTLDDGLWTLDATLLTLGSGHWTLSSTVSEQNQNPISEIELHYKQLSWTVHSHPSPKIYPENTGGRVLLLVKLQTGCSE